jgi:guanylate kinase
MRTLVALVGASGSGKTAASLFLKDKIGWGVVTSYTTRPMREGEADGREHIFVTADRMPPKERMCAYTKFGGYDYWAEWDQIKDGGCTAYVIDEKGLADLMGHEQSPFPFRMVAVRITRKDLPGIDEARKQRDKERIRLPESLFDYTIDNDGTLEEFYEKIRETAKDIERHGDTDKQ